jgi:hypothetical protein
VEALAMIREVQRGWIAARLAHGLPIPEPEEAEEHSYTCRFGVRIPKDVHRALVAAAEAQGVSLNGYVAMILAQAVQRPAAGAKVEELVREVRTAAEEISSTREAIVEAGQHVQHQGQVTTQALQRLVHELQGLTLR